MEEREAIIEQPSVDCNSRKRKSMCPSISCRTGYPLVKDLRSKRVFTRCVHSVLEGEDSGNLKMVADPHLDAAKPINGGLEIPRLLASGAEFEESKVRNGENLKVQAHMCDGTPSKGKMTVNPCRRKKVFKDASSVSYHRLLPYLMNTMNVEDPDRSNFEIFDARKPCQTARLQNGNSEVGSSYVNGYSASSENVVSRFNEKVTLEKEGIPNVSAEVPCNRQLLDCASENFTPRVDDFEYKGPGKLPSTVDNLMERENCLMTPPDSDIVAKINPDHHEKTTEESNAVSENKTDRVLPVASKQTNNGSFVQSPGCKSVFRPTNGMVLKPCSGLRVFNNPRSLSYRRLLPFLKDISKDNSETGAAMVIEHPKPHVEVTEDLYSPSATSTEQNCANKVATENAYEKHSSEETVPVTNADFPSPDTNPHLPMPQPLSTNCSYATEEDKSITSLFQSCSMPNDGNLTDRSNLDEPEPVENSKRCSGIAQDSHNSDGALVNEGSLRQSLVKIEASDILVAPSTVRQEDTHKSCGKSVDEPSLSQSSFQIGACDPPITPSNETFKGVLNRNPRRCRGLCSCLNCASFRLHADRAFEFSQNQMHDASEVAFTLMEELKNIRSMLEKLTSYEDDLHVPQLNMVQVKEACNKALEIENLAKERLSQMNYELNIHCRVPALQQPKVTFANYLQERLVPVEYPSARAQGKRGSSINKISKENRRAKVF